MSGPLTSGLTHRKLRSSHGKQDSVDVGSIAEDVRHGQGQATNETTKEDGKEFGAQSGYHVCTLSIHGESFSKEGAIFDPTLFPDSTIKVGDCVRLTAVGPDTLRDGKVVRHRTTNGSEPLASHVDATLLDQVEHKRFYVFVVQEANPSLNPRYSNPQVSLSQSIASALNFKNRDQVVVAKVTRGCCTASHVEIAFRDVYLTRGDMWRLVAMELSNKSIHRGQKIIFLGTIKAHIKTIYKDGQKVSSAFFGGSTKPIFRSESARYVLFIQMSKEMWDFDADGTGEIMFNKVINGFLPELFHRWHEIGARHVVSIILFTRLEYGRQSGAGYDTAIPDQCIPEYKDFYRVLVSDVSSSVWTVILEDLKKEFKVYLRDVLLAGMKADSVFSNMTGDLPFGRAQNKTISGKLASAANGNILEAINLASSQFSGDYIDRDLIRTGLSIVVITPGTGIFEVDRDVLSTTTDVLIENGIGIDLVCLSRMPLHSVPLFKYRRHHMSHSTSRDTPENPDIVLPALVCSNESFASSGKHVSNFHMSEPEQTPPSNLSHRKGRGQQDWYYGIPHWIDVSFWTRSSDGAGQQRLPHDFQQYGRTSRRPMAFVPRVRMYELQMMGLMENEMSNISVPYLDRSVQNSKAHRSSRFSNPRSYNSSFRQHEGHLTRNGRQLNAEETHEILLRSSNKSLSAVESGNLLQWMDRYDNLVFRRPGKRSKAFLKSRDTPSKSRRQKDPQKLNNEALSHKKPSTSRSVSKNTTESKGAHPESKARTQPLSLGGSTASTARTSSKVSSNSTDSQLRPTNKLPRQINFGFRRLGGPVPKAVASTEVTSEHAQSESLLTRGIRRDTVKSQDLISSMNKSQHTKRDNIDSSTTSTTDSDEGSIRPIAIVKKAVTGATPSHTMVDDSENHNKGSSSDDLSKEQRREVSAQDIRALPITMSPGSALAPWMTVLNPSNPRKMDSRSGSRLGRWHHVFPKPLRTSTIKWKSLCSPASIPLTTNDCPSADQLAVQYYESFYSIARHHEDDMSETPHTGHWLIQELVSFRLSHGFQIMVGSRLAEAFDDTSLENPDIFDGDLIGQGTVFFMSRGSSIHKLTSLVDGSVQIKAFTRRSTAGRASANIPGETSSTYRSSIRTFLSSDYTIRELSFGREREAFDWERVDSFLAGHEKQQPERFADGLHFWRARFVLIPIDPPANSRRPVSSLNEDNEEETRLEGILNLTRSWQRHRWVPPDERRFQSSTRKRKDHNPLDILYQTRNPSAIVAAELDSTLLLENDPGVAKPLQLLPDSDLFERGNLNLQSLAPIIQGERGVRSVDRRWHWRLHQSSFIGFELVTWLLNNFRDVDTRAEAVELGNELMNAGLFEHVEKRHELRDGNYFYRFAGEYRIRIDARTSWFGARRLDKSIPSTPTAESTKEFPTAKIARPRSGIEDDEAALDDGTTTPKKQQKLGVELSKQLTYDVDHRRRSYRQELINLHFDRLSNPDSCYHLRIDWMNVTPKLIEDAIVTWALSAERYGLRLVEIPIKEASKINELHPFRAPYLIKLALDPPQKVPELSYDSTSFSPQPGSAELPYHKAILKKFNFVLDLEAARDFPSSVNVEYSWGKPDYQYPQYVSREGVLMAQISQEGYFLLLANRLYNNKSLSARDTGRPEGNGHDSHRSRDHGKSALQFQSPSASPYSSPMLRAVPETNPKSRSADPVTPEQIKDTLEEFCSDALALESFYEEVLSKNSSVGPNTPSIERIVPALGLPPTLNIGAGLRSTSIATGNNRKGNQSLEGSPDIRATEDS
ncbi:vacuolar membrane-associated protein iml1 [Bachmanniomyces sp. S44760]|nr:vacuolar membrane-associated protein iml1 [Bachmanniomyces sp. S44760]